MNAPRPGQRFDDAWQEALSIADDVASDGIDVLVVRDLLGRATVILGDSVDRTYPAEKRDDLESQLRRRCSPFVAERPVLDAADLFAPDALLSAPDLIVLREADAETGIGRLAVLERGVVGREWRQVKPDPAMNRVTLYGFKGGVGRSTSTAVLARYLAGEGFCVLAVDLDLESPGLSAVALDQAEVPDYGLVDVLAESLVGNVYGLDCVARSGRLRVSGNGEVWIASAGGRARPGYTYLPKLNRAYVDAPELAFSTSAENSTGTEVTSFASRLRAAVDYCTQEVERRSRRPDVVLLDSRAGMHDIAAIAITQLSDLTLLFGVDNAQTWNGYREMFQQWKADVKLTRIIRERLRMVAAMVPASHAAEYLARFRDNAQLLFGELLYDEAGPDDLDAFNPPLSDTDAPHSPLPILFSTDLVGIDIAGSIEWLDQDFVNAAFGEFVRGAADLILGARGGDR